VALFDGYAWRQDPRQRGDDPSSQLPASPSSLERWSQRIRVTLRNLRSSSFVTAGITTRVEGESGYPIGGGVFNSPDGLNRGDSYSAEVYTPNPSDRELRVNDDTHYDDWLRSYLAIYLPEPGLTPAADLNDVRSQPVRVAFPSWDDPAGPEAERFGEFEGSADRFLAASDLASVWTLAQRLRRESATAFEYVQRVEALLGDGFAYSEQPPRASETLTGFLFESKVGFCQQFSGAEALLLRMGGIPARVATGFTSGSFDDREREFIVRDLDAHSWV
jgi:transglutaminase-like putative cysteine protease